MADRDPDPQSLGFLRGVGLLMFEFSHFWLSDYEHGRDFVADLDSFLARQARH